MKKYYVNDRAQANGDHEVHHEDCRYLPSEATFLGLHPNCWSAVTVAKVHYKQVNGCRHCSQECDTQ